MVDVELTELSLPMTDGTNIPIGEITKLVLSAGPTELDDDELELEEDEPPELDVASAELGMTSDDTAKRALRVEPPANPDSPLDVDGEEVNPELGTVELGAASGPSEVLPLSNADPSALSEPLTVASRIPEIEPDDPVNAVSIAEFSSLEPVPLEELNPLATVTSVVPAGAVELPNIASTTTARLASPIDPVAASVVVVVVHSN